MVRIGDVMEIKYLIRNTVCKQCMQGRKTRCPYKDIDNEFCPEVELIVDYLEFLEKSFENLQKSLDKCNSIKYN